MENDVENKKSLIEIITSLKYEIEKMETIIENQTHTIAFLNDTRNSAKEEIIKLKQENKIYQSLLNFSKNNSN